MIVQSDSIRFELRGEILLLHVKGENGHKYAIVLNKLFDNPILESLRQHQTFALLNPEE